MKTKVFFALIIISPLLRRGAGGEVFAQSCANYAVTRTTGITYTSIVGTGTSAFIWRNTASNLNDDNRSYQVPIGFDFWYLGVRYTNISAQLNGTVDFSASTSNGNTSPWNYGSNWLGQFSAGGSSGTMLALAPFYEDLWTANGGTNPIATSLVYKLSGTAPNRVLTVEWINFDEWNSPVNSPPYSVNMQVKIHENTGVIDFVYGTMNAPVAPNGSNRSCGINGYWTPAGAPTAAQMLEQQTINTTTFNNTPSNALTALPTSNTQLTFTPPTPNAAPTGLTFTAVTKNGMTLNWTDNATNEVGYVIYNSTDNITFNFVTQVAANSVSAAITGLLPSTTYYWQVYAVTDGALSTALIGTQTTLPAGTVTSIATGPWSSPTTWDCACVPSSGDNVIIANGTTVKLNTNGACNSLAVGQGTSGQFNIGINGTAHTLAIATNATVNVGAFMTIGGSFAVTHSLTIGGNLINNGTMNLAPTATTVCNVTFTNNGNQTISGTGATTNFNRITLNMGAANTNVLEVMSSNFSVLPTNFLTLTNGTFKLSTAATVTPFTGNVTIPLSCGLWLNNATATMNTTGGSITLYGYVRVTAGTLNIGNAANNNLTSYGGTIIIDGGAVNMAGALTKFGPTIITNFTMSSGTLTVATVGSTVVGVAPFQIDEIGSTFNMSGGTIIIRRPGAGNLGYVNTGGTVGTVTSGTLQIGDALTPTTQTIQINASIPVYNLVVSNGVAVTAQLATNSLTVKNNLTINTGTLQANALGITLGGNWLDAGTFTPGTGTVIFNGAAAQIITKTIGEIFNNLTINNTSTGVTLGANVRVSGAFTHTSGIVNLNSKTLTLNGAVAFPVSVTNGSFTGSSASIITIGGTGAITNSMFMNQATPGTTNSLLNLTLNRTGQTLTLGNSLNLIGKLTPTAGTFASAGNLTLIASSPTVSAWIGTIGGSVTGNVTVQTYEKGGNTGWCLMGEPGVNATNTFQQWNSAFQITCGTCPNGCCPGGSAFTSIYSYLETTGGTFSNTARYVPITNITNVATMGQGYWVYLGNGQTTTTDIKISTTGPVNQGNFVYNITFSAIAPGTAATDWGYNLIANPYPAPISWTSLRAANASVANAIYAYNPDLSGYASYVNTISSPAVGSGGIGNMIAAGQGIYVKASAATTLTALESYKGASSQYLVRTSNPAKTDSVAIPTMVFRLTASNSTMHNETAIYFDANATANYDIEYDALSLGVDAGYLGITSVWKDTVYAINGLPALTSNISIPIKVITGITGSYQIAANDSLPSRTCIQLHDKYMNTDWDLRTGAYNCTLTDTEEVARFVLNIVLDTAFSCAGIKTLASSKNHMQISRDATGYYVQFNYSSKTNALIAVYNVLGEKVIADINLENVLTNKTYVPLNNADNNMLIISVITDAGEKTYRKVVNQ
ncbi:MAG: beta strand repeat-containing protein [Bacteroidia bacterium]